MTELLENSGVSGVLCTAARLEDVCGFVRLVAGTHSHSSNSYLDIHRLSLRVSGGKQETAG